MICEAGCHVCFSVLLLLLAMRLVTNQSQSSHNLVTNQSQSSHSLVTNQSQSSHNLVTNQSQSSHNLVTNGHVLIRFDPNSTAWIPLTPPCNFPLPVLRLLYEIKEPSPSAPVGHYDWREVAVVQLLGGAGSDVIHRPWHRSPHIRPLAGEYAVAPSVTASVSENRNLPWDVTA